MVQKEIKLYDRYQDLIDFTDKNVRINIINLNDIKIKIEREIRNNDFKSKLKEKLKKSAELLKKDIQDFIDNCNSI